MPSYLISGPSGSGKSTVGRVLKQRGFRVIETDFEDGLSAWVDKATGNKVSKMPAQPYTQEWVSAHSWLWSKDRMKALLESVCDEQVFFSGGAHNEKDFYGSFQLRFGLSTNNDTLRSRLQPREPKRWSDDSIELKNQLEWNSKFIDYCRTTGAIVIDSSQSPDLVADSILSYINKV